MPGTSNSGGYRPTAKQNNPANVSAIGGAGQTGQPTMYIPNMRSLGSSGQDTMAQQKSALLFKDKTTMPTPAAPVPLTAPSQMPDQSVMHGAPIGGGSNTLPELPKAPTGDVDLDMMRNYYPIIQFYASQPGASQGIKDYATYLGTVL